MDTFDVLSGLVILAFCLIIGIQLGILHIYTEIELINKKLNTITNPSGTLIKTTEAIPDEKSKSE